MILFKKSSSIPDIISGMNAEFYRQLIFYFRSEQNIENMLKDLFEYLITYLGTNIPSLKKVDRYKGELEEGSQWTPVFPCVFIRLDGWKPKTISADGSVLDWDIFISFHLADKDTAEAKVLDLLDSIQSLVDGIDITVNDTTYKIIVAADGGQWSAYFKGVEVYSFMTYLT